jgi:streptogramin lyase
MGKPISLLAGQDRLLVGTERGVLWLDLSTDTWEERLGPSAGKAISCLAKQNQVYWVGTLGYGLYCLDWKAERWAQSRSDRLPSSGVNAIACRESEVWMATGGGVRDWRGGLSRLNRRTGEWQTWTERDGISHWAVNAIALDGERVWIGTRGGLNLFLPRTARWRTWDQEHGLKDPFVVSLAVGLGRVWFGTDRAGAGYLDPKSRKIRFLRPPQGWGPRAVEAIVVDGGRVWFACWDGVRWYHPQSGKWGALRVADGLIYPVVWAMGIDRDSLWLGTSRGLSRRSKAQGKFETFDRTRGLPDDFVWAMALGEESLYFGTQGGGVAEFRKRDSDWHVMNSSQGLASDEVYCVTLAKDKTVAGKGELWVGTYGGVSRRVRQ